MARQPDAPRSLDARGRVVDVAVVVAAYQAEPFLAECVASVLAQSLQSFHLVIVDDGSTDGTLRIARSCADARVLVITGPNRGPAYARNAGVRAAAPSRYIAFLDADDVWDPPKLAVQTRFLDEHPEVAGVGCRMRYISSKGRVLGETGELIDAEKQRAIARGELFPFPTPSLMTPRTAFDAVGGFEEFLGTQGSEDLDLYARLARYGQMVCLPSTLGSVRIHRRSLMSQRRREINRAARFVRQRLIARDQGRDLTWEEFLRQHPPTWRERRRDLVERAYRRAALLYGERQFPRALACFSAAALIDPTYTLRRAYRQRWGGSAATCHASVIGHADAGRQE
jgi:glycosyltransferase involved in cell wall biosynthesis